MTGFINGITAVLFLVCITTLLGEAQNFQQKPAEPNYNSNGPSVRSVGYSERESTRYNPNTYDYRLHSPVSTNYPPYRQYPHNHDHDYYHSHNHNRNLNFGNGRWDYSGSSNQYPNPNPYNPYYQPSNEHYGNRYSTERVYSYRHPTPYTEGYNWMTTKKYVPPRPNKGNPGQLSEKNDNLNITSEEEPVNRNNIKRKSEDYDPNKMVDPNKMMDPNKMVYPNETPNVRFLDPKNPPKNCTYGLCDTAIEYPEEKIRSIISKSKELQQYFAGLNEGYKPDINIVNRFGEDDESLCPTMKHTHFPQSAVNTDNIEKYLVNVGEYKQGIVLETCRTPGKSCKFSESFPTGYTPVCEQKYSVQRLMSARKDSEDVIFDNFRLPTCCVCTVTRDKT